VTSRRGTVSLGACAPAPALAAAATDAQTTLVLRDLPEELDRDGLVRTVAAQGFGRSCDFLYLPHNFRKSRIFGYAILNFVTPTEAQRALAHFAGFVFSGKVASCAWSTSIQGIATLTEKYRNSSIMHPKTPALYQPLLLVAGKPIRFPAPDEELRLPASPELLTTRTERS